MIKIALLGTRPDTQYIEQYEIHNVSEDIGTKQYYTVLSKHLNEFTKTHQIDKVDFSFTIAPLGKDITSINVLDLPQVEDKVLKEAIEFEMGQRDLVETIDDNHFLWNINTFPEEEGDELSVDMDVVVTTIKKDIIYELAQLRKLKWTISNIEVQSSSIGRFIEGDEAVVDFGYTSTRVYLFKDGELDYVEYIESAGNTIQNTISEALVDIPDETLEMYQEKAVLDKGLALIEPEELNDLENYSNILTQETGFIVDEVKRIIRSYEIREFTTISNIHYTGGLTKVEKFHELFQGELDSAARPFTVNLATVNESDENVIYSVTDNTLLGLATSSMFAEEVPYHEGMNYAQFLKFKYDLVSILIAVLALSLTLHIGVFFMNTQYSDSVRELESVKVTQERKYTDLNDASIELQSTQREYEQLINTVDALENEQKWYSYLLYILPEKTPEDVSIRQINIQDSGTVIQGFANDYSSIAYLALELEEVGKVIINDVQRDDEKIRELEEFTFTQGYGESDIPNLNYKSNLVFELKITEDKPEETTNNNDEEDIEDDKPTNKENESE